MKSCWWLQVPMKKSKKGRLWLIDGSCVRLRPEHRDHVWSYDFVHCRTDDGKAFRTLSTIDALSDLFILRGTPSFMRSDNGPEFVAQAVQDWNKAVGAKTLCIEQAQIGQIVHVLCQRKLQRQEQEMIFVIRGRRPDQKNAEIAGIVRCADLRSKEKLRHRSAAVV